LERSWSGAARKFLELELSWSGGLENVWSWTRGYVGWSGAGAERLENVWSCSGPSLAGWAEPILGAATTYVPPYLISFIHI